jgi:hypothetical protein
MIIIKTDRTAKRSVSRADMRIRHITLFPRRRARAGGIVAILTIAPVDLKHGSNETMTSNPLLRVLLHPLCAAISPASWYNIGLAALLVVGVVAFVWAYRVWSEINEREDPATAEELMEAFDEARAAGELDEEEYARVRERIRQPGSSPPPGNRGKLPE